MTVSIDPTGFAAALDVPVSLIAYVLDEYEGDEACGPFELYLADRISEAAYLHHIYLSSDVDAADESSAEIFAEILELLDFDMDAYLEKEGLSV